MSAPAAELAPLAEPRRFIQVVAGARQVGKTTLVEQVTGATQLSFRFASADEPSLRGPEWIATQWEAARLDAGRKGGLLVIAELQKAAGWSESVKRLWDEDTRAARPLKVVLAEMRNAFDFTLDQYLYFGGYPGAAPLAASRHAGGGTSSTRSWRPRSLAIFCC